jgi:hypothetical protein
MGALRSLKMISGWPATRMRISLNTTCRASLGSSAPSTEPPSKAVLYRASESSALSVARIDARSFAAGALNVDVSSGMPPSSVAADLGAAAALPAAAPAAAGPAAAGAGALMGKPSSSAVPPAGKRCGTSLPCPPVCRLAGCCCLLVAWLVYGRRRAATLQNKHHTRPCPSAPPAEIITSNASSGREPQLRNIDN